MNKNKYNSILDNNKFIPYSEYIPVCIPDDVNIGNKNYKKGAIIMLNLSQQSVKASAKTTRRGRNWTAIVETMLGKCKAEDGSFDSEKVRTAFNFDEGSGSINLYKHIVETSIQIAKLIEAKKQSEAKAILEAEAKSYKKLIVKCLQLHQVAI